MFHHVSLAGQSGYQAECCACGRNLEGPFDGQEREGFAGGKAVCKGEVEKKSDFRNKF